MELVRSIAAAFTLFIVVTFTVYVIVISIGLKRKPPLTAGTPTDFEWHILIPCLNEATVIDRTIRSLLELRNTAAANANVHLWLIDDGSDDTTLDILRRFALRDDCHVVARNLPNARQGKSEALNAAFRAVGAWRHQQLKTTTIAESNVIIGVVDADGRLSPDSFSVLSGAWCFADPSVGAVQQDVWMRNVDTDRPRPDVGKARNSLGRVLLRLQDIEFRASIAAIQHSRHRTGSVCMGGNGQWTRLSALSDIDEGTGPWKGSLLEDFELGLHLLLAGWKTRFTPGCWVSQEALPSVRRLIHQRTRWAQGSMQCARYFPTLWRSRTIPHTAILEIGWYLLQPWMFIAATFLYPLVLIDFARLALRSPDQLGQWFTHQGGWIFTVVYALVAIGPLASWGLTYRKQQHRTTGPRNEHLMARPQAIALGLAYVLYVQLSYIVAWNALVRLLRKRNSWHKTARTAG